MSDDEGGKRKKVEPKTKVKQEESLVKLEKDKAKASLQTRTPSQVMPGKQHVKIETEEAHKTCDHNTSDDSADLFDDENELGINADVVTDTMIILRNKQLARDAANVDDDTLLVAVDAWNAVYRCLYKKGTPDEAEHQKTKKRLQKCVTKAALRLADAETELDFQVRIVKRMRELIEDFRTNVIPENYDVYKDAQDAQVKLEEGKPEALSGKHVRDFVYWANVREKTMKRSREGEGDSDVSDVSQKRPRRDRRLRTMHNPAFGSHGECGLNGGDGLVHGGGANGADGAWGKEVTTNPMPYLKVGDLVVVMMRVPPEEGKKDDTKLEINGMIDSIVPRKDGGVIVSIDTTHVCEVTKTRVTDKFSADYAEQLNELHPTLSDDSKAEMLIISTRVHATYKTFVPLPTNSAGTLDVWKNAHMKPNTPMMVVNFGVAEIEGKEDDEEEDVVLCVRDDTETTVDLPDRVHCDMCKKKCNKQNVQCVCEKYDLCIACSQLPRSDESVTHGQPPHEFRALGEEKNAYEKQREDRVNSNNEQMRMLFMDSDIPVDLCVKPKHKAKAAESQGEEEESDSSSSGDKSSEQSSERSWSEEEDSDDEDSDEDSDDEDDDEEGDADNEKTDNSDEEDEADEEEGAG